MFTLENEGEHPLLAETLSRVGLAFSAVLDLSHLLDLICQESMNLFKVGAACIWLVQGSELVGLAAQGRGREEFIGLRMPLAEPFSLAARIIREKRPMFVNDAIKSNLVSQDLTQLLQVKAILGVPLIKAENPVGALMLLDFDHAHRFGPEEVKRATVLGSFAVIAIENARLLEVEREQRALSEVLRQIGSNLSASLDFNTVLDRLLEEVARIVPYDSGNVFLIEHGYARVVRTRGHEQFGPEIAQAAARLSFELTTTPNLSWMIETKQPLIIPDTESNSGWLKGEVWRHVRSWAGAPIIAQGQVVALFSLDKTEPNFYQPKHAEHLATFASQAGLALENARLYTAAQRRLEEQKVLREASAVISATLDLPIVLKHIAEQMGRAVDATSAYICRLEPETMISTLIAEYFSPAAATQELVSELGYTYDLLRDFPALCAALKAGEFSLFYVDDPNLADSMRAYMRRYGVHTMLDFPLQIGGQTLAYAEVWDSRPRVFTPEEIALCQDLARQAAVAIKNAQLFDQTRHQAQHLAMLNQLAREITGVLEAKELCDIVAERVGSAFNHLNVAIFTLDPASQKLVLQSIAGVYKGLIIPIETSLDIGKGFISQAAPTDRVVAANNNDTHHPPLFHLAGPDIQAELAIPLKVGEQLLGVMNINSCQPNTLSDSDVAALTTVADQLAVALEKVRLFAETRQRAEQLEALRRLSQDLTALRNLDALLYQIAERAVQLLNGDGGGIYLYYPERQELELVITLGPKSLPVGVTLKPNEGVSGKVWSRREPLIVDDYQAWPGKLPQWPELSTLTVVGVPIQWGEEALGVLNVHADNARRRFTVEDATLLAQFATQAAIAIQNLRLYDQTQRYTVELESRVAERTFELQALCELAQSLGQATRLGDVIRLILLHLYQAIPHDIAASLITTETTSTLMIQSQRPLSNNLEAQIQEIMITVLGRPQADKPLEVHRIQAQAEPATNPPLENLASMMQVPIVVDGVSIGLLFVATEQSHRFSQEQQRLLRIIADQAADSIRRLQSLLAAEHQRLESLVAHLPNGVVVLDAEQRITLANPAARQYLAALTPATIGDKLTHLAEQPLEAILTVSSLPGGEGYPVEVIGPSSQVYAIIAEPLAGGPEAGGWLLVIWDNTEARAIQERIKQQERLAAVGQLAAGIAHDFNNILTSIIGFAELVRLQPEIPDMAQDDLQRIINQGQRAARLVRQVLDFSRQSIAEKRPLDLAAFLKETIKLLERTIPENIRITHHIEPRLDAYHLNADPVQLQQALTNLAVNARDAMPTGGELHFRLSSLTLTPDQRPPYPEMPPGNWVMLTVSDTGKGIPLEVLPRIFDPFFTTKEIGKGVGLGLAQVYGIITQHGGFIDVKTELEKGATFILYLPALPPLPKFSAQNIELETIRGNGELILLVEDDPAVLEVTQAMLEHLGYRVITAANGRQALEVFEQRCQEIALLLTDITMPEMGGMVLAQILRAKYPAVKIIALTGYPLDADSKDLLNQGIVAWLQKPLSRRELAQAISRSLKIDPGR